MQSQVILPFRFSGAGRFFRAGQQGSGRAERLRISVFASEAQIIHASQAVQNREVGDIRKTAIKDCAAKLKALQTQTDQLKNGKLRLYEKYTSGSISKAEYLKQKTAFDEKLAENAEAIQKAHEQMQELDSECSCSDERVKQVCEQYRNQTALTFELTHAFIKAIYVHDADNIEILWKFGDIYEETEGKK